MTIRSCEWVRAIREIVNGKKYLSAEVARGVVDDYVELSAVRREIAAFVTLTDT